MHRRLVRRFLLLNGRVAGISGIIDGAFQPPSLRSLSNLLFALGLIAGPVAFWLALGAWPVVHVSDSIPLYVLAGLLVGFGTRLGSGCTSGHGVCGLARLSPRSFVAVVTFLAAGVATVLLMRVIS
ncbi:MAG TPA: YeeE/YedE family protein [Pirellulales bacterium]